MQFSILKSLVCLLLMAFLQILPKPEVGDFLYRLSNHYAKTNKPDLASRYMTLAIEEQSEVLFLEEGCNYVKKGNINKAKEYFKKASGIYAALALIVIDNGPKKAVEYIQKQQNNIENPYPLTLSDLANVCFLMGKYPEAERYYKQAIEIGLDSGRYSNLAQFYKKLRKYDLAIKFYLKALENGEPDYDTIGLGKIYYKQGKLDLAQIFFERLISKGSCPYDANLYLALIHYSRGEIAFGEKYLSAINIKAPTTIDPKAIKAIIKEQNKIKREVCIIECIGNAYLNAKQYTESLPYLLKASEQEHKTCSIGNNIGKIYRKIGSFDLAEETYQKILTLSPWNSMAFYGLGRVAEKKELYDQAEQYYKKALSIWREERTLARLIRVYEKQNKLELAELYAYKLLRKGSRKQLFKQGFYYHQKNNLRWAKKFYKIAASKGSDGAMQNLGQIYLLQGKFIDAKLYLERVAEKGCVGAVNDLGRLYFYQNEFDHAEFFYKKAADQNNVDAINNLSFLYCKQNKIDLAIELLTTSIKKIADPSLFYILAFMLEKKGKLAIAKKYYELASKAGNTLAAGKIHEFNGEFDLAEKYFREALDGGHPAALYLLSVLYKKMGKEELAAEFLKKANERGVIH